MNSSKSRAQRARDPPARADGIDGGDGVGGGGDGGGGGGCSDRDGDRDGDGGGASGGGDSNGSCSDSGEEGKGGGGKGAGGDEAPSAALVGRDGADPSDGAALLKGQDGTTRQEGQAIDWQALAWRSKRLANQEVDRARLLDPRKRLPPYAPEAATLCARGCHPMRQRLPPYEPR